MNKYLLLIPTLAFSGYSLADNTGLYIDAHLGNAQIRLTDIKVKDFSSTAPSSKFTPEQDIRKDNVLTGGFSVGYNFQYRYNIPIRAELNYTAHGRFDKGKTVHLPYKTEFAHDSKLGLQTLMTNVWLDIPTGLPITPYVGGGMGLAYIEYKGKQTFNSTQVINTSGYKSNFAWQVGTGINYRLNAQWSLDLGYRYVYAGKISSDRWTSVQAGAPTHFSDKAKVKSNEYMLTARYTF